MFDITRFTSSDGRPAGEAYDWFRRAEGLLANGDAAAAVPLLERAIVEAKELFEPRVAFVRLLGFVEKTAARQISLEDSLRFEAVHENVYRRYGFALDFVQPADIDTRIRAVLAFM